MSFTDAAARQHLTFRERNSRLRDEDGVTTAEYAIGTCAATGLAGVLFHLLTGQQVMDLLWRVITHAFSFLFNL